MHRLRRLRYRLQCGREKHALHELPAARQDWRRAYLYSNGGRLRRETAGWSDRPCNPSRRRYIFRRHHNQRETGGLGCGSVGFAQNLAAITGQRSSDQRLFLGSRFSGNGDFFGLAYNSNQLTDILGWGNHRNDPIAQGVRAGPSIVGLVRYNEKAPPAQRFVIEDLSIPRAYR